MWFRGFEGTKRFGRAEYQEGSRALEICEATRNVPCLSVEFETPLRVGPLEIRPAVAAALRRLGWGPEVDAYGRQVRDA